MAVAEGRTGLEVISPRECWELLASSAVGRIGVIVDSAPEIYPVNHVVDGESILFRTDAGSKLQGLEQSPAVCFECDGLDPDERTGWSVLVKGRGVRAGGADSLEGERSPQLWAPGQETSLIRITPHEVTGRRISAARSHWWHSDISAQGLGGFRRSIS